MAKRHAIYTCVGNCSNAHAHAVYMYNVDDCCMAKALMLLPCIMFSLQYNSMQTSMHTVEEASMILTALVKNTPAKLQTSPTHQIMIIHKERPSELPLMKLMMICGRQHMPINTTDAKPRMKEVRSVVLHMQSPNVLAQVAQPGSHVTPIPSARLG